MAHFRGTVCGDKSNSTNASRLGHKTLVTNANGWDAGVRVNLYINNGRDCACIWLNGGSNDIGPRIVIYDGPIDDNARDALVGSGQYSRDLAKIERSTLVVI